MVRVAPLVAELEGDPWEGRTFAQSPQWRPLLTDAVAEAFRQGVAGLFADLLRCATPQGFPLAEVGPVSPYSPALPFYSFLSLTQR
jgi:hypothetical protein